MTSSISRDAPSQFAALLRRSKFASYDQKIGQVYTAFGGHAHRGDWGLKRPLPQKIRVRRPLITISSVDSINQQTEWERSGPSTRFVEQWNEMGMDQVTPDETSAFAGDRAASIDSDFARRPGMSDLERVQPFARRRTLAKEVPMKNIHKMRPKEFERYLDRLRQLRPKFNEFVLKEGPKLLAQGQATKAQSYTSVAQIRAHPSSESIPDHFISQEVSLSAGGEGTTWIEQRPHPLGGLTYTTTSPLQSLYFFPPVVGRLVDLNSKTTTTTTNSAEGATHSGVFIAAVSGVLATVEGSDMKGQRLVDFGPYGRPDSSEEKWNERNPHQGIVPLRINNASVQRIPRVVGVKPEDLVKGAKLTGVRASVWEPKAFYNAALPGSPDWVKNNTANVVVDVPSGVQTQPRQQRLGSIFNKPKIPQTPASTSKGVVTANVMDTLGRLIKKQKDGGDEEQEQEQ
ncbi:hypothetical protein EXIGLDRAFT_722962 [Exidia glandulosa HHB12029]|uniref:Uncharacterized protein n=1 Tax=Exidia glandulosa HHB12029 TaxID=1314781 RepID=A0A165F0Q2_EXIGL|nr:hypothetical protein EXIGLDRAFT_722962 [Exidia glandulosa HHB12029]